MAHIGLKRGSTYRIKTWDKVCFVEPPARSQSNKTLGQDSVPTPYYGASLAWPSRIEDEQE